MPPPQLPGNGIIIPSELATFIEPLGFMLDEKRVDALTYELADRALKRHFRLLAKIRVEEAVVVQAEQTLSAPITPDFGPQYRIMGTLWFGRYFSDGFVIEVFGRDIQDHMTSGAHQLSAMLNGDAQVMCRTLRKKHFE